MRFDTQGSVHFDRSLFVAKFPFTIDDSTLLPNKPGGDTSTSSKKNSRRTDQSEPNPTFATDNHSQPPGRYGNHDAFNDQGRDANPFSHQQNPQYPTEDSDLFADQDLNQFFKQDNDHDHTGHKHHRHRHHHHHHHHDHGHMEPIGEHSRTPLIIRRHTSDSLYSPQQQIPLYMQAPTGNVTPSSQISVAIRRNPASFDRTVIQPILYPVPVYVPTPVAPIPEPPPPPPPPPPLLPPPPPPPHVVIIRETVKPSSPVPVKAPTPAPPTPPPRPRPRPSIIKIKLPPTPPLSPDRFETESFRLPSSRSRSHTVRFRTPVRTRVLPIRAPRRRYEPHRLIVDEVVPFPPGHAAPGVARGGSVAQPGSQFTTRELENMAIARNPGAGYRHAPPSQNITYRT